MSGLPLSCVTALVHDRGGASLSALLTRAGLPESTFPAFRAALEARDEIGFVGTVGGATRLRRRMVERVLTVCETAPTEVSEPLLILLRRFATESAREEARVFCDELVAEAAAEPALEEAPVCAPRFSERHAFEPQLAEPEPYEPEPYEVSLTNSSPTSPSLTNSIITKSKSHAIEPYAIESCESEHREPRFDNLRLTTQGAASRCSANCLWSVTPAILMLGYVPGIAERWITGSRRAKRRRSLNGLPGNLVVSMDGNEVVFYATGAMPGARMASRCSGRSWLTAARYSSATRRSLRLSSFAMTSVPRLVCSRTIA